ncbi:hypothetical protein TRVL_04477 [Trypanosoma vivax]|nr:hypothetical protein TRVL_04477 [Trypanosoma vivax]
MKLLLQGNPLRPGETSGVTLGSAYQRTRIALNVPAGSSRVRRASNAARPRVPGSIRTTSFTPESRWRCILSLSWPSASCPPQSCRTGHGAGAWLPPRKSTRPWYHVEPTGVGRAHVS